MLFSATFAVALVQLCAAGTIGKRWNDLVKKHSWSEAPKGWEFTGPAPGHQLMNLKLGMKQNNLEGLIEALYEVSTPHHEKCVDFPSNFTTRY
jgi:tripeptidyl-peptidase-1